MHHIAEWIPLIASILNLAAAVHNLTARLRHRATADVRGDRDTSAR